MSLHTWWLYAATVFVISAIPGPNMLLVMTHGARHGLRRATATMAGCLSALILMLSVSAAGIGVFLKAWPAMFDALRFAGAAYLFYLGVKAWRAEVGDAPGAGETAGAAPGVPQGAGAAMPAAGLFRSGFLVASSNPKAILFAAALLPQFIDAAKPVLPQFGILVATFAVIEIGWYAVYAVCRRRIGVALKRASVARAFNRLTGGVFVGFGAAMALVRH